MTFLETIEKNRQNFLNFNRKKYERFQMLILNPDIRKVINAVPLLLSVNDPKVPGYVPSKVPMGIFAYRPDDETLKFAESKFRVPNLQVSNNNSFIEMLAVLGSVGTIAYTKNSDCDYWVCVNKKKASKDDLANLQKKIDEIQNWVMAEAGKEIHLFINDIESLKQNIYAEDEDEAFGSVIGATLKDEFYRSSIIIAGKVPFWWVTPHVDDAQYEAMYKQMPDEIRINKYIDLGNMYSIPKEDFMGAALFQLVKALGNPFKSILKIGVLEKYLFGPPLPYLLCHKIKEAIHRGEFVTEILDAYIMMFEAVYEYYSEIMDDKKLLNALRQNLYLKINPQLTKYAGIKNSKNLPYKVEIMSLYVVKWNWSVDEIKDLDNFDNWDYTKILAFWNTVKRFMLLSYQKIANEMPNFNLEQRISETDFKLLNHKIKANFIPDKSSIDNHITFKDTPYESILYIEPAKLGIKDEEWRVYKRNMDKPTVTTNLKVESDLIKLMAWIAINQIFDPVFTRVQVQSGYTRIEQGVVQGLLTEMSNLFSKKKVSLKNEFFLSPAFSIKNMLIINFNEKGADSIHSVYSLTKNSWGQAYIRHYTNSDVLIAILQALLTDSVKLRLPYDDVCVIHVPEPFKKEYKAIDRFYREAYNTVISRETQNSMRFIGKLGSNFIMVTRERKHIAVAKQTNLLSILSAMTLSPKQNMEYVFASEEPQLQFIKEILTQRKPNTVSIIYYDKASYIFLYIINEGGNIFSHVLKHERKETALISFCDFMRKVIPMVNKESLALGLQNEIELIRLSQTRDGFSFYNDTGFLKRLYENKPTAPRSFSAVVRKSEMGQKLYSIIWPNGAKTPFLSFEDLAKAVQAMSKTQTAVGFVDSIQFTGLTKEELLLGTGLYIMEKIRIDSLLARLA